MSHRSTLLYSGIISRFLRVCEASYILTKQSVASFRSKAEELLTEFSSLVECQPTMWNIATNSWRPSHPTKRSTWGICPMEHGLASLCEASGLSQQGLQSGQTYRLMNTNLHPEPVQCEYASLSFLGFGPNARRPGFASDSAVLIFSLHGASLNTSSELRLRPRLSFESLSSPL